MLAVDSLTLPSFVWSEHLTMGRGGRGGIKLEFDLWHHLSDCFSPACNWERMHIVCFASRMNLYISINIYIYKYTINNKWWTISRTFLTASVVWNASMHAIKFLIDMWNYKCDVFQYSRFELFPSSDYICKGQLCFLYLYTVYIYDFCNLFFCL